MKTFLGFPDPQSLKPSHLWACAAINQLAFPGLGSVIAGRRGGYVQAGLFLAGFILVICYLLWMLLCIFRYLGNPVGDEQALRAQYLPYAWAWKAGLACCVVAWCCALVSSLGIARQARDMAPG